MLKSQYNNIAKVLIARGGNLVGRLAWHPSWMPYTRLPRAWRSVKATTVANCFQKSLCLDKKNPTTMDIKEFLPIPGDQ